MALTTRILLALWLNPLPSDYCYLWLLLEVGIFVSLTYRMLSYMEYSRKKCSCVNLQVLPILYILIIFVDLRKLSTGLNKPPEPGMLG
jgi:hypothetical protein